MATKWKKGQEVLYSNPSYPALNGKIVVLVSDVDEEQDAAEASYVGSTQTLSTEYFMIPLKTETETETTPVSWFVYNPGGSVAMTKFATEKEAEDQATKTLSSSQSNKPVYVLRSVKTVNTKVTTSFVWTQHDDGKPKHLIESGLYVYRSSQNMTDYNEQLCRLLHIRVDSDKAESLVKFGNGHEFYVNDKDLHPTYF